MVVDFLRSPNLTFESPPSSWPSCLRNSMGNLPQAWTIDLDEAARRNKALENARSIQVSMLQSTTLMETLVAQVAGYHGEMEAQRARYADLSKINVKLGSSLEEAKRSLEETQGQVRSLEASRMTLTELAKEAELREKEALAELETAKAKAEEVTAELVRGKQAAEARLKEVQQAEKAKSSALFDKKKNGFTSFAYIMAMTDAIRALKEADAAANIVLKFIACKIRILK